MRLIIALYFFPLLFASRLPAQANTSAQTAEATVLMLENAWNQAVRLGESKTLQELFVNGLVYIDYDGEIMNKGQYLAHVQKFLLHPEYVVAESMQAHAYGQSVVVTGVYRKKGTKNGQPYALRERFVDTWIQQKGAWVCASSQSTLISH